MLMTTVMCGVMSIVLFSMYRSFRAEVDGVGHWSLGLLLMVLASLLFGLRDTLPEPVALLGANCALLWGIGLSMIGTQRFYGRRPAWYVFHTVWAAGMGGMAWCLLVVPDFGARVAIFSFLVLVFYTVQLALVVRHGERHFSSYFFGFLMLVQSLAVLTRGAAALLYGGASVNLLKSGTLASLYLATANFMALLLTVGFMVAATRRLQTILERRATHDPLTLVLNRRGFAEVYARQRAQLWRDARPMSLLSIDLDHFKSVNDRFGHATGDRVLIHVARQIGEALRETDYMARFGGEEFVVLLPDTLLERAQVVALRIQAALRQASYSQHLPPCTVSIGVACQTEADETLEGVLSRTDAALYRAKEKGRDRVELADAVSLTVARPAYAVESDSVH